MDDVPGAVFDAAAGAGDDDDDDGVTAGAVSGPPFLNLIMGTWGLTVANLLMMLTLTELDIVVVFIVS